MRPYFEDDAVSLYWGDALAVLRELSSGSVDCCVTSPPYFGLRDYGTEGQYGHEASAAEYAATMRAVFGEVRRVLADDGTLWLNSGDSYSGSSRGTWGSDAGRQTGSAKERYVPLRSDLPNAGSNYGLPAKNLLGIPWRTAFALQDDGWILRNAVIWNKPNAMPESVTDRLSGRYEHVFLFSKSRRYWFDLDPIREPVVYPAGSSAPTRSRDTKEADVPGQTMRQHRSARTHGKASATNLAPSGTRHYNGDDARGRNPGDVWSIPTQPFAEAHFACMPTALAERCVLAGCKPSGVVMDPFSGSGTTGLAAGKHGRRYVGIDLNRDYLDLSLRTRLAQAPLLDGESA